MQRTDRLVHADHPPAVRVLGPSGAVGGSWGSSDLSDTRPRQSLYDRTCLTCDITGCPRVSSLGSSVAAARGAEFRRQRRVECWRWRVEDVAARITTFLRDDPALSRHPRRPTPCRAGPISAPGRRPHVKIDRLAAFDSPRPPSCDARGMADRMAPALPLRRCRRRSHERSQRLPSRRCGTRSGQRRTALRPTDALPLADGVSAMLGGCMDSDWVSLCACRARPWFRRRRRAG